MKRTALICIIGLGLLSSARAEPPPASFFGGFEQGFIGCQAKADLDQAMSLRESDGYQAALAFLKAKEEVVEEHNKTPLCFYRNVGMVAIGENFDYGVRSTPKGGLVHYWGVHAGTSDLDFWLLWWEPVEGKAI